MCITTVILINCSQGMFVWCVCKHGTPVVYCIHEAYTFGEQSLLNFSAILSNYNGMTAYICRQLIPITAFLVYFCNIHHCNNMTKNTKTSGYALQSRNEWSCPPLTSSNTFQNFKTTDCNLAALYFKMLGKYTWASHTISCRITDITMSSL